MGLKAICVLFIATLLIEGICGFSVSGNKLLDANGKQFLVRGVDRCSFEWSPTGEQASLSDYQLMKQWGTNTVRIPMNQDFWLSGSATYSSGYAAVIQQQVTWITSIGMNVILDLHWSDMGNLQISSGAQQCMADTNSITFWTEVATAYKNNPNVMFELYNEPHDVAWSVWLNGGNGGTGSCDFEVAGMQQLYNAVRATGANNVVIVGGLNWAFDLSGVATYPVVGTNIAYATHPYDYTGKDSTTWDASFGYLTATYPVIATEFGQYCNTDDYVQTLLAYMQTNEIHWTAWAWYVSGCAFPSIINDWNGTPYPGVGQLVQSYLGGNISAISSAGSGTGSSTSAPSSPPIAANSNLVVYTDALQSGWSSYGWASDLTYSATTYVYAGSDSISFTPQNYAGAYMHFSSTFDPNAYASLQFYVNGGTGSGQSLSVTLYDTSSTPAATGTKVALPTALKQNSWVLETIPMSSFGISSGTYVTGFAIVANTGTAEPTVYIDNISFILSTSSGSTTAPTTTKAPSVTTTTTTTTTTSTPAPTTSTTTTKATTTTTKAPTTTTTTTTVAPSTSTTTTTTTSTPAPAPTTTTTSTPAPSTSTTTTSTPAPTTSAPTSTAAPSVSTTTTTSPSKATTTSAPTKAPVTASPTSAKTSSPSTTASPSPTAARTSTTAAPTAARTSTAAPSPSSTGKKATTTTTRKPSTTTTTAKPATPVAMKIDFVVSGNSSVVNLNSIASAVASLFGINVKDVGVGIAQQIAHQRSVSYVVHVSVYTQVSDAAVAAQLNNNTYVVSTVQNSLSSPSSGLANAFTAAGVDPAVVAANMNDGAESSSDVETITPVTASPSIAPTNPTTTQTTSTQAQTTTTTTTKPTTTTTTTKSPTQSSSTTNNTPKTTTSSSTTKTSTTAASSSTTKMNNGISYELGSSNSATAITTTSGNVLFFAVVAIICCMFL